VSQERVRAGSRLPKVDNLTGVSLLPGGPKNASERGEMVVKSEPVSTPPKSKLLSARDSSGEINKINVKKKHYGENVIKNEKFTDSEGENERRDTRKKFDKKPNKKPKKDSSPEESDSSDSEKEDKKKSRKKRESSPRGSRKSLLP